MAVFVFALLMLRGSIPLTRGLAAAADHPAVVVYAGRVLVPRGDGRVRAGSGADHGVRADAVVLCDPDLLSGDESAARLVPILSRNPIYVLVRGYRAIFLEHSAPMLGPLLKLWIVAVLVFLAGHAWFYKLRKVFADVI